MARRVGVCLAQCVWIPTALKVCAPKEEQDPSQPCCDTAPKTSTAVGLHTHWARYTPTRWAIMLHPPLTNHGDISALATPQVYYSCWLLYRQNTIYCERDLVTNHS